MTMPPSERSFGRIVHRWQHGCAALLGGAVAMGALAAPLEPNVDRIAVPDSAAAAAIERLRLSDTLADFGQRSADPIALIEAAKIRKMLPPPLNAAANASPAARTWEGLLTRAAQFAGPNPMVAAFIEDVRHLQVRDIPVIPLGVTFMHKQIKQNSADRAEVRFLAGELAVIYIRPVAAADLEFFVYDDLNNLICTAGSTGEGAECRWRPRRDGSYLIDVRNRNSAEVEYELAINHETVPR